MRYIVIAALLLASCTGPDEVIPPGWYIDAPTVDAQQADACGSHGPDAGVDAAADAGVGTP